MTSPGLPDPISHRNLTAFFLLSIFTLLIYSNTFNASWHLDDFHNIIHNPHIRIANLYPDTLRQACMASYDHGRYTGNTLYRPVAMLSFAMNWYWGNDNVVGYHLVNIVVHIFAAFFLYLVILNLLDTPNVKDQYQGRRHPVALTASLLWAIHPIQTQAVTYIVQRMASASGMFFMAGLYVYLKLRRTGCRYRKAGLSLVLMLLYLLAMGCKENAVMLPVLIIVLEIMFFRDWQTLMQKKQKLLLISFLAGLVLILAALFILDFNPENLLAGYEKRSFSPIERLLTQPRVLIFYLYQIFYPVAGIYSIAHDIEISRSLMTPWTTVPAILLVFLLIGFSVSQFQKRPVLSFSIGFFFLNHAIESSIIPLEIIFEHRNYLPSMFLFLPLATGLQSAMIHFRTKGKHIGCILTIGSTVILFFTMGIGSYTRNFVWKTETSLWTDAIQNAPLRARPYQLLGYQYLTGSTPDYKKAAGLYLKSVGLKADQSLGVARNAYSKLSRIFSEQKKYDAAVEYAARIAALDPDNNDVLLQYVLRLIEADLLEQANDKLNALLEKQPENSELYIIKSRILMKLGRMSEAEGFVKTAMALDPLNLRSQNYFAIYHFRTRHYKRADYYFNKVMASAGPGDQILFLLALIENSMKAGWEGKKQAYMDTLFSDFSLDMVESKMISLANDKYPEIPLLLDQLADEIAYGINGIRLAGMPEAIQ